MPFKLKDLSVSPINAHLLGAFIRLHRECEKMSLSFMADSVKISKAYLSDLEHGRRIPQEYTFIQILKILGVPFSDDINIVEFLENKLHELFKSYVDLNEKKENLMYDEEFISDVKYEYSLGFIQFYLINFMRIIRLDSKNEKKNTYIALLNKNLELMSNEDKNIYYDLLALNAILDNENDIALMYLKEGLENPTNLTTPIINYHMCIVYQNLNLATEGLSCCFKSQELFNKEVSFFRILYLMIYEANCYSRLHNYKLAETLYLNVLDKSSLDQSGDLLITVLNNLGWNALKEKNYDNCIKYTRKAIALNSKFLNIYLYLPFSFYYKNELEMCKCEINDSYKQFASNTFHFYALEVLSCLISENKIEAKVLLMKCLTMNLEYEMDIFMLQLMCEILNDLKDFEELSIYQKKLIDYFL